MGFCETKSAYRGLIYLSCASTSLSPFDLCSGERDGLFLWLGLRGFEVLVGDFEVNWLCLGAGTTLPTLTRELPAIEALPTKVAGSFSASG